MNHKLLSNKIASLGSKSWIKHIHMHPHIKNGVGPTKSSRARSVPISKNLSKLLKELKLKNRGLLLI